MRSFSSSRLLRVQPSRRFDASPRIGATAGNDHSLEWLGASVVALTGVVSWSILTSSHSSRHSPPSHSSTTLCSNSPSGSMLVVDPAVSKHPHKRSYLLQNIKNHHYSWITTSPAYDTSVRAMKGNRVTMEDEYVMAHGGRVVAVFDGHGGGGVSRYLQQNFLKTWKYFTHEEFQKEGQPGKAPSLNSYVQALRQSFAQIDNDILAQDPLQYQGSTAVVLVLHEDTQTLLSANVGDSRAILSRKKRALDLTRDHKPNDDREKARILALNETIEWDALAKVHRVRNLSLSRAMGDRYAKPVVSSQVEIQHHAVTPEDEFCLVASDGVWDVMNSQEVVSFVHQKMEKELSQVHLPEDQDNMKLVLRRSMAKFVAREAFRRGSGDNICVCMVWLDKKKEK